MGEVADAIYDGTLCQECGGAFGDVEAKGSPGYPRTCRVCKRARYMERKRRKREEQGR